MNNDNISKLKLILIIIVAVVGVILLSVFFAQSFKNNAIGLEEQVATAQSDINVQEKRRADLIPNLVDCVKEYDKHEYETLIAVIGARKGDTITESDVKEIKTMINAVAEQYPDLKSNENYKELMNELSTTENLISNYRSNYNSTVQRYNSYVRDFPNSFFLSITGYDKVDYQRLNFDVSSDAPSNLFG